MAAVTDVVKKVGSVVGVGGGGGTAPLPVAAAPASAPVAAVKSSMSADEIAAQNKARGRASTLAAGEDTMLEDQMQRGLLKKQQRQGAVSRTLLG